MTTHIKTDTEIQRHVLDELQWEPMVKATDVGVEVNSGIVTLSGTVENYAMKHAAERAALRVLGTRAVANDIAVKPSAHGLAGDTVIAQAIANAFDNDVFVPVGTVQVQVESGLVTLSGPVEWQFQRAAAEEDARRVHGVRSVRNEMSVHQPTVTAATIRTGIEQALVRTARTEAGGVKVVVDGGHVTLSGAVRSWAEREEAESAAWRARGVTRVTDRIDVQP